MRSAWPRGSHRRTAGAPTSTAAAHPAPGKRWQRALASVQGGNDVRAVSLTVTLISDIGACTRPARDEGSAERPSRSHHHVPATTVHLTPRNRATRTALRLGPQANKKE